jgi:hypothetical protein
MISISSSGFSKLYSMVTEHNPDMIVLDEQTVPISKSRFTR